MTSPVCGLLCLVLVLVLSEAQGTTPHRKVSSARPRASGVSPQVAPRLQSLQQRPNDAQRGARNFQQQEPTRNHLIPQQQERRGRNNAGRFDNLHIHNFIFNFYLYLFLFFKRFSCFVFMLELRQVFLQSLPTFMQLKRKFSWFSFIFLGRDINIPSKATHLLYALTFVRLTSLVW